MNILEVNNISKTFSESKEKSGIHNISFSLAPGEVLALVGPSGGGKTTLLRVLAGLEKIDKGEILLLGKSVQTHDKAAYENIKENINFVFQDYNLWPHKTVLENIILPLVVNKKVSKEMAIRRATDLLKKFDLLEKKDVYPDFLSGGQKQRVAIIRSLAMQPKILLLDEITSSLDPELIKGVLNIIKVLAKDGQSMIITTHHLQFASEVATRIIFLEKGNVVQENTARDFVYAQKNERIEKFLQNFSLNKQEINVYEGYDQFQAYQIGLLKRLKKGSTLHVVGSSGDRWFECMGEDYDQYEKLRIQKKISWNMIMYKESELDHDLRMRYPKLNTYRLIPKNIENPANYYVAQDLVVIQIFGGPRDEPAIIEIKNPNVAKSYLNYFNLLWEQSVVIE